MEKLIEKLKKLQPYIVTLILLLSLILIYMYTTTGLPSLMVVLTVIITGLTYTMLVDQISNDWYSLEQSLSKKLVGLETKLSGDCVVKVEDVSVKEQRGLMELLLYLIQGKNWETTVSLSIKNGSINSSTLTSVLQKNGIRNVIGNSYKIETVSRVEHSPTSDVDIIFSTTNVDSLENNIINQLPTYIEKATLSQDAVGNTPISINIVIPDWKKYPISFSIFLKHFYDYALVSNGIFRLLIHNEFTVVTTERGETFQIEVKSRNYREKFSSIDEFIGSIGPLLSVDVRVDGDVFILNTTHGEQELSLNKTQDGVEYSLAGISYIDGHTAGIYINTEESSDNTNVNIIIEQTNKSVNAGKFYKEFEEKTFRNITFSQKESPPNLAAGLNAHMIVLHSEAHKNIYPIWYT